MLGCDKLGGEFEDASVGGGGVGVDDRSDWAEFDGTLEAFFDVFNESSSLSI